jgi:hypothetical protein
MLIGGMPQILLKQAKQASLWIMLCGVSVMLNSLGDVRMGRCLGFQSMEAGRGS